MGSAKLAAWKREKGSGVQQDVRKGMACCVGSILVILVLYEFGLFSTMYSFCSSPLVALSNTTSQSERVPHRSLTSLEFDCNRWSQIGPVVAHRVEKVNYPFFISIADLGTPEKPNRNFQRILKGKLFQRPAISETVQSFLTKSKDNGIDKERTLVIDVGANVGMATFAAAAMGFEVLAFEPVVENVYKLCDGVYLNRVSSLVQLYHLAVSNSPGHITVHKVVGRLDNSAVSATGAKLAFKSNEVIPVTVKSVTLDSMIPASLPVLLLKIDVQGWEYNVLKGASKLLSRRPQEAPYIIYEEDEKLLRESNSTSEQILQFLGSHGYLYCSIEGGDRHCSKEKLW